MAAEDYFDIYDLDNPEYYDDGPSSDTNSPIEMWTWKHEKTRCKGQPVKRRNSMTGDYFIGCSKFPACKITAS